MTVARGVSRACAALAEAEIVFAQRITWLAGALFSRGVEDPNLNRNRYVRSHVGLRNPAPPVVRFGGRPAGRGWRARHAMMIRGGHAPAGCGCSVRSVPSGMDPWLRPERKRQPGGSGGWADPTRCADIAAATIADAATPGRAAGRIGRARHGWTTRNNLSLFFSRLRGILTASQRNLSAGPRSPSDAEVTGNRRPDSFRASAAAPIARRCPRDSPEGDRTEVEPHGETSAHPWKTTTGAAPSLLDAGSQPLGPQPPADLDALGSDCKPESVQIAALVRTGSPRSGGVDSAHVQRLIEADWPLPPIVVHRPTMRVIDGFHRVAAAVQLGLDEIDAYVIDGSVESMFVLAVRANVTHGLPLSLADRRRAADRILCTHADWSDRAIASATGLSAKTVRGIRCASREHPQLHKRLGKDGRLRPLDASAGRRLAAELLASSPDASLREIAAAVGVSPGTVRDVRARLSRGDDPVPTGVEPGGARRRAQRRAPHVQANSAPSDLLPVLVTLSKDPALRMNAGGRELLRWLHAHAVYTVDSAKIVQFAPAHCVEHLVEFASRCSTNWALIAADLEQRAEQQQLAPIRALPATGPAATRMHVHGDQRRSSQDRVPGTQRRIG
jgi:ParB-like chromosome segregation protein Spo0J